MLKSETGIPGVAGGGRVQALVEFGAEDSPINRTGISFNQSRALRNLGKLLSG